LRRSDSRILTTHVGSLPRPDDLLALNADIAQTPHADRAAYAARLRAAVQDVVRRQQDLGLDVVNDGEYGKAMRSRLDYGAWISYVIERFTGFEEQDATGEVGRGRPSGRPDEAIKPGSHKNRRDRQAFPEVYADVDREMFAGGPRPMGRPIVGKVTYRGHHALQADIDNLRDALVGADLKVGPYDAFMTTPAPGTFAAIRTGTTRRRKSFSSPSPTRCASSTARSPMPGSSCRSTIRAWRRTGTRWTRP
jgi:5-methyltetrahydropteroyltriglutamate--homocysteine methyltransferase